MRATAVSTYTTGPYTRSRSATPFNSADLPGIPRNLRLTAGDTWIRAEWEAPNDRGNPPLTGYQVYIREGSSGNWIGGLPRWVNGTSTSTRYDDRKNGQPYQVRVAVFNIHGEAIAGPKRATPSAG